LPGGKLTFIQAQNVGEFSDEMVRRMALARFKKTYIRRGSIHPVSNRFLRQIQLPPLLSDHVTEVGIGL